MKEKILLTLMVALTLMELYWIDLSLRAIERELLK